MNKNHLSEELLRRLTLPTSVEDLRGVLPHLLPLLMDPDAAESASDHLQQAFRDLRRMTADDSALASEILVEDMLPLCFARDARGDSTADELRRMLARWLGRLPERPRMKTREAILDRTIEALHGPAIEDAISLIWSIGFWDEKVKDALKAIVSAREDDAGDHALAALAALHAIQSDGALSEVRDRLHRRIPIGYSRHREVACRLLGTGETAELLWVHWFAVEATPEVKRAAMEWFGWHVLVDIAACIGSPDLVLRTWGWLVELLHSSPDQSQSLLKMDNYVVDHLDVRDAVPEFMRLLSRSYDAGRFAIYDRVLECKRPAVLSGWDHVSLDNLDLVKVEATKPTGQPGRFTTIEMSCKSSAWEVLLCRGVASELPSIDAALDGEDAFGMRRFLELAACLGLHSLPASLDGLIAGSSHPDWSDHERVMTQSAAINVALSVGGRDAFEALLGYRAYGKPGVLLSVVEALAETALHLVEAGDAEVIGRILDVAETAEDPAARKAAGAAVGFLLQLGSLDVSAMRRAGDLLARSDIEPFTIHKLIHGFLPLAPESVPTTVFDFARRFVKAGPPDGPWVSEIRQAAVSLLALQSESDPSLRFFADNTGLRIGEGGIVDLVAIQHAPPYMVGRFFEKDPGRFADAVAAMVLKLDVLQLPLLFPWLRTVPQQLPVIVVDAIVGRLRSADASLHYDPELLRILAREAPARFLTDLCSDTTRWLSEARADLADLLEGMNGLSEELSNARFDILVRLCGDGLYGVRRSAYRAAATSDPNRFLELALDWAGWASPGLQGPRIYAAECAGWLLHLDGSDALKGLADDPEPEVRSAYRRSIKERNNRLMADEFQSRVLAVEESGQIVANWRYGVALGRVGDDTTLRRLKRREEECRSPAVRFWLARVLKAVERRWSDETRRWPEPWYLQRGHLEHFDGILRAGGSDVHVSGILWLMRPEDPTEPYSWGGRGSTEGADLLFMSFDAAKDEGYHQLILPHRSNGRIVLGSSNYDAHRGTCSFRFNGSGPYPE